MVFQIHNQYLDNCEVCVYIFLSACLCLCCSHALWRPIVEHALRWTRGSRSPPIFWPSPEYPWAAQSRNCSLARHHQTPPFQFTWADGWCRQQGCLTTVIHFSTSVPESVQSSRPTDFPTDRDPSSGVLRWRPPFRLPLLLSEHLSGLQWPPTRRWAGAASPGQWWSAPTSCGSLPPILWRPPSCWGLPPTAHISWRSSEPTEERLQSMAARKQSRP